MKPKKEKKADKDVKPASVLQRQELSSEALKEVERIQPLADRLVVLPQQAPDKIGHIIVPDSAKENNKPCCGHIVAVGPGSRELPMTLNVGERITYPKYAGTEVTLDGGEYLIMRYTDVFALVDEDAIIR